MTDLAFSHNLSFCLCGVCRGLDCNTAPFPTFPNTIFPNTFSSTLHSVPSNLGQFHPPTDLRQVVPATLSSASVSDTRKWVSQYVHDKPGPLRLLTPSHAPLPNSRMLAGESRKVQDLRRN